MPSQSSLDATDQYPACPHPLPTRTHAAAPAEGDSFIVCFAVAAHACAFACSCQLALLEVAWPAELLCHPDAELMEVHPKGSTISRAPTAFAIR
jgi:hypothetical protein